MKKFLIPLLMVAVAAIFFAGCLPKAAAPAPVAPAPAAPAPAAPAPAAPAPAAPAPAGWAPTAENPFKGLGIKPDGTQYYFSYLPTWLTNEYEIFTEKVVETYWGLAGIRMDVRDANGDLMTQLSICEDLCAIKPDSILIGALEGKAICPGIDKMADAGIPGFSDDNRTYCDSMVTITWNDSVECSKGAARLAIADAKRMNKPLNILIIQGAKGAVCTPQRVEGFTDTIAEEGEGLVTTMVSDFCGFAAGPAADAVISILPAHPEINGVYETGGGMIDGVIEGLRTLGQLKPIDDPGHIWVCMFGLYPEGTDYVAEKIVDGWSQYSPYVCAGTAILAQFKYVCLGKPVPHEIMILGKSYSTRDIVVGSDEWNALDGVIMKAMKTGTGEIKPLTNFGFIEWP